MNSKKNSKKLKQFYLEKEQSKSESLREKQRGINKLKSKNFTETKEEKELYKKFYKLASKAPNKKFDGKHIEDLNTKADVIVFYGKKGIGKTRQIAQIIDKLAKEDPDAEIILIRNTVSEFQALQKQLDYYYGPIYLKGISKSNPDLYHKHIEVDGSPRKMGFCVALNGKALEAAKGGEYPNVKLIIGDECTNVGNGDEYDESDIARFVTFFDSIIRSKKDTKIYIFGNFHRNTDGQVSDVLLDTLNIPYGAKLKVFESESGNKKQKSKLLYINSGNLYEGIDNNAKIGLFGQQLEEDLLSNIPESECPKVGGINVFYEHDPKGGLLFNEGTQTYILLLSEYKDDEKEKNMLHIEKFPTRRKFLHPLYTADIFLYNAYNKKNVHLITKIEFRNFLHTLFEIQEELRLFFSNDNAVKLFRPIMDKGQEKYNLGATVIFNKKSRTKIQGF